MTIVFFDISLCNTVVEPVTANFSDNGGNDRGEVEKANLFRAEVVEGGEEDGQGCVDAYDPGEGEAVVDN